MSPQPDRLIEDFLQYARPAQSRRELIPAREIIEDTVRIFENDPALTSNVALVVDSSVGAKGEINVYADPSQIQQVLWNLLRNACEAMPDGGTVTISESTHYDLRTGRDFVNVSVRDTGTGLPAHVIPNLFEPFFTTKDGGSGLGLAACHRIALAHRGLLVGENLPGGGASFTLSLPADPNARDLARSAVTADPLAFTGMTDASTSGAIPRTNG